MIHSLLTEENAFVYMCGSIRSCQGIESALASILQSCSGEHLTSIHANNLLKEHKELDRIKQNMFG
jgi:sulfite reductase alpha subunit-like flavoprotein